MNWKIVGLELNYSLNLISVIILYPVLIVIALIYTIIKFIRNKCKNKSIAGQVAVVTGSGRGLGRDIAIELAKRGCHVAIVDIQEKLAEETSKYIAEKFSVKTKAYKIDVTDYQQLVDLKNKVTNDLGDTTILINNAGILLLSSIKNPTSQEVQQMINVNFTSHVFANQIFLPRMKHLNTGHIVTISSLSALTPLASAAVYSATKSAVRSLTASLRMELMDEDANITATAVMPCFLTTNKHVDELIQLTKMDKLFPSVDGDVVAKYVVKGMLNGDREITIPQGMLYFYKLVELLPFCIKDVILLLLNKIAKKAFESAEGKAILKKSEVHS